MDNSAAPTARASVLVVEDSDDQRDLLRTYLQKAGCAVVAVPTAEDAIAAYLHDTPDLVIVDLLLPGMNGWDFVRRLRVDRPECVVIISSALDEIEFPASEGQLPKPFTRVQLLQLLEDCVPE